MGENQPNTKKTACGRVFMFSWSVEGGREVGGGTAGEGRMGVRIYIQCNNQKTKPFVRMGMTAHPHPRMLVPTRPPFRVVTSWGRVDVSVGAGGNGWEAPNTKNVPTMADFSRSGGKRTREGVAASGVKWGWWVRDESARGTQRRGWGWARCAHSTKGSFYFF